MFDWKKPTVQMLGRWQPWHQGHQELFKRCVAKTGQVIIQVRDVQGASGGTGQDDNPFDWDLVCKNIEEGLAKDDFHRGNQYEIMLGSGAHFRAGGRSRVRVLHMFEWERSSRTLSRGSGANFHGRLACFLGAKNLAAGRGASESARMGGRF